MDTKTKNLVAAVLLGLLALHGLYGLIMMFIVPGAMMYGWNIVVYLVSTIVPGLGAWVAYQGFGFPNKIAAAILYFIGLFLFNILDIVRSFQYFMESLQYRISGLVIIIIKFAVFIVATFFFMSDEKYGKGGKQSSENMYDKMLKEGKITQEEYDILNQSK